MPKIRLFHPDYNRWLPNFTESALSRMRQGSRALPPVRNYTSP